MKEREAMSSGFFTELQALTVNLSITLVSTEVFMEKMVRDD